MNGTKNGLPMKGKITSELSTSKEKVISPKQSTIDFLRIFARVYTCETAIGAGKRLLLN